MSRCGWFHTALSRWSHSYSNIVLHPKILFLQYFYSSTIRFGDFELVSSPKSSKISPSSTSHQPILHATAPPKGCGTTRQVGDHARVGLRAPRLTQRTKRNGLTRFADRRCWVNVCRLFWKMGENCIYIYIIIYIP